MFFKFLCVILGIFLLTGNVYAQDKSLRLRQAPEVVKTYCAIAEKLNEAQKDETKIFMGFIDHGTDGNCFDRTKAKERCRLKKEYREKDTW